MYVVKYQDNGIISRVWIAVFINNELHCKEYLIEPSCWLPSVGQVYIIVYFRGL